ncbi:MAG: hypothetical protein WEE36_10835, partial [Acidimicrobiia bacterium]
SDSTRETESNVGKLAAVTGTDAGPSSASLRSRSGPAFARGREADMSTLLELAIARSPLPDTFV